MSDLNATVKPTDSGFAVCGYEKIEYDFTFLDGVFSPSNPQLAECYKKWGRVFCIADTNICSLYGAEIAAYFAAHGLPLTMHKTKIGEKAKNMDTMLSICEAMTEFGIIRKEPVLVVGGGLITDVAGFACAAYRRTTNFIRVPTTVVGLIDASVSIKVAVNQGKHKNRLGAYHAPIHTFLDFTFLRTLPESQVRNGFAELIKIASCAEKRTFDLLDQHCTDLITHKFGRSSDAPKGLMAAADEINRRGIHRMLELETPNLHELALDRVIAFGHTWSPTLELAPETPLRHGHAISIDMAYTTTLALMKGIISPEVHTRILSLFSRAGLAIDHVLFDEVLLAKGTDAILKTRDGKLRLACPAPQIGECVFLNDLPQSELDAALRLHKEYAGKYARGGDGVDAYVDSSDTGVEMSEVEARLQAVPAMMKGMAN
ncbi:hypothetical protein EDC01DRAFT_747426 [Geopyxis carbonaria]|nr:hypothetical protein EDC01DRAFT_747426 [Geopyxis carbonaria]